MNQATHRGGSGILRRARRLRAFALATLLFLAAATALRAQPQSQYSLSPLSNPAQIVPAGDSVRFEVVVLSQTAGSGQLEIVLPAGFRLLPKSLIAGTLTPDGLSGRMAVTFAAGDPLTCAFYAQPLCDVATAVDDDARKVTYNLYINTVALVASKQTDPIANFYDPILNIVYPAGTLVTLNSTVTRVIEITQTANASHVNNLRIEAAVTDKTGITVSKIEVSRNGADWTDITATGLDASQAGKYVYNITRANTFSLATFNYPGNQLQADAKLYLRETVTLIKCSAGSVN
ncbi:MAG: hypothetical protein LBP50_00630, partial [Tannerella sp.]|nr:hypothetical protein [Tannerella sp.]